MDSSQSKADKTRQFIIEATASIFNRKGYAGTSLSDLTEATQLSKGSIYGNFENKEAVALAAFDHNYEQISGLIRARMYAAPSFSEKLMVYAQVYDQFTRTSLFPSGGCPILNTAVEADDTHPLLKEKASRAIQRWKKTIQQLIQGGIDAGEFTAGVDIQQISLSIIALIEGGIMIAKVTNSQANLDKVLQTVADMINEMKA